MQVLPDSLNTFLSWENVEHHPILVNVRGQETKDAQTRQALSEIKRQFNPKKYKKSKIIIPYYADCALTVQGVIDFLELPFETFWETSHSLNKLFMRFQWASIIKEKTAKDPNLGLILVLIGGLLSEKVFQKSYGSKYLVNQIV